MNEADIAHPTWSDVAKDFRISLANVLIVLQDRLFVLIRENYFQFYDINLQLEGLNGKSLNLVNHIDNLFECASKISEKLKLAVGDADENIKRKQSYALQRGVLEAVIHGGSVLSGLENLIYSVLKEHTEQGYAMCSRSTSQIVIISSVELFRLLATTSCTSELPFTQKLYPRVQKLKEEMPEYIIPLIHIAMRRKLSVLLTACISSLYVLRREDVLTTYLVNEFESSIARAYKDALTASSSLPALYENTLKIFMSRLTLEEGALVMLKDALMETKNFVSEKQKRDGIISSIMSTRVCQEIDVKSTLGQSIADTVYLFFTSSKFEQFKNVFSVSQDFLDSYFVTLKFISELDTALDCGTFLSQNLLLKFDIPSYFQWRKNCVLFRYTQMLQKQSNHQKEFPETESSSSISTSSELIFGSSQYLWSCILDSFDECQKYPGLVQMFMRHVILLVLYYKNSCEMHVNYFDTVRNDNDDKRNSIGRRSKILLNLSIIEDIKMFSSKLIDLGRKDSSLVSRSIKSQLNNQVEAGKALLAGDLEVVCDRMRFSIMDNISSFCICEVKHVKGITATFRMTNKPIPERHSGYIDSMLQVLELVAKNCRLESTKHEIVGQIFPKICDRFRDSVQELVDSIRKSESSLRKLQESKNFHSVGPQVPGSMSDVEKIFLQLLLDVKEFGQRIYSLQFDPRSERVFLELWELVAPSGIDITLN